MGEGAKNNDVHKPKSKGPSALPKYYLILYNFLQTIGWAILLGQIVQYYTNSEINSKLPLYDHVKWTVILFQNAAVLEVVHAAVRLVPSSPFITATQVSSRVIVVCGVLIPTLAAKESIGLPLALLAWSITEIIRYSTYMLNLLNSVPFFLLWLRYSTFIILYPLGVTGELLCIYAAQQEVAKTGLFSIYMPNNYNVVFYYDYFLLATMLVYIPGFPQLYLHMFSQRKKLLGPQKKQENGIAKKVK